LQTMLGQESRLCGVRTWHFLCASTDFQSFGCDRNQVIVAISAGWSAWQFYLLINY
jgi:hypothetical protein